MVTNPFACLRTNCLAKVGALDVRKVSGRSGKPICLPRGTALNSFAVLYDHSDNHRTALR